MEQISTVNIIKAIFSVLSSLNKPISANELSFRTRTTESLVKKSLNQLKEANVVIEHNDYFQLNKNEGQYRIESMLK